MTSSGVWKKCENCAKVWKKCRKSVKVWKKCRKSVEKVWIPAKSVEKVWIAAKSVILWGGSHATPQEITRILCGRSYSPLRETPGFCVVEAIPSLGKHRDSKVLYGRCYSPLGETQGFCVVEAMPPSSSLFRHLSFGRPPCRPLFSHLCNLSSVRHSGTGPHSRSPGV